MTPKRVAVLLASVIVLGTLSSWLVPVHAHAASRRRVVLAIWTEDPSDNLVFDVEHGGEPRDRLLRTLDGRPGMSVGLVSSVQGGFIRKQAVLDISQGSRQPSGLYASPSDELSLRAVPTGEGARIAGWDDARRRARDVSVTLRPGLLASSVPGGAGYVGTGGPDDDEVAVIAADERGFVASFSTGRADTIGARVLELLDARAFVVVALPGGDAGRAALGDLVATRADGDLLFVMHLPRTPAKGEYGRAPARFYRLTAAGLSGDVDGSLRSASTRRQGLVSATDVLPTVLEHLGRPVPDAARGEPVRTTSALGPRAWRSYDVGGATYVTADSRRLSAPSSGPRS